ncbi:ABC transporter [Micromonospora sp. WMMD1082]|uniref:ABC transporter n=1 Tax=Micromonospora sp. WMMD1082 TaxID=3016104 RepID=UPI002416A821|nr:ABC transporter [Micromonospora sp. WMMD1082]MDG4794833.1 ABC transporter [Micromonospora sp. WMMD1082]
MTTNGDPASLSGSPAVAARTGPAGAGEDRPAASGDAALSDALTGLRAAIGAARFPLALPSAEAARRSAAALADQLDDYLLPRLSRLDAPLLVVVGGSTGAGKSTLVNSLVQARVSAAGVLRPTTRSPVLVCSPTDSAWFRRGELLPGLTRTNQPSADPRTLHLVTAPALAPGLAFLDAPDIDSVVDANRALAGQLLAAADLWLFVTTAARYADAVPWELLRGARARGAAIALVLDRVPVEATDEVAAHLAEMLAEQELGSAPLFVLPETWVDGQGLLPGRVTAPLADWFARLAADAEARSAVVRQTLGGALATLQPSVESLAAAAEEQVTAANAMDERVLAAYRAASRTVEQGLRDGRLLRGEVLARWQEFIGTSDFFRTLEARIGRLRDRVIAAFSRRPAPAVELRDAIESQLVTLLRGVAAEAAEHAYTGWKAHPAGAALLEPELAHHSADLPERAERLVRDWQRGVLELVRAEGGDRRFVARTAAYAVNATGLVVMIAVFASTAFIPTGLEVATGAGTTIAGQAVLQAIFGDQAVRTLANKAREDLLNRVSVLLDTEAARYLARTEQARPAARTATALRRAANRVETARLHSNFPTPVPPPQPPVDHEVVVPETGVSGQQLHDQPSRWGANGPVAGRERP